MEPGFKSLSSSDLFSLFSEPKPDPKRAQNRIRIPIYAGSECGTGSRPTLFRTLTILAMVLTLDGNKNTLRMFEGNQAFSEEEKSDL